MNIWQFILDEIIHGSRVVLLLNVHSSGSSPGKAGFKMVLSSSGQRTGTIGGSVMEFNLLKEAVTMLGKETSVPVVKSLVHNARDPESSGLICAGRQITVLIPLSAYNTETIRSLAESEASGRTGILSVTQSGISFSYSDYNPGMKAISYNSRSETDWEYKELVNRVPFVFVFGAGHTGSNVFKAISLLRYPCVLFDERPDYPQKNMRLTGAGELKVYHNYEEVRKLFVARYFPAAIVCTNAYPSDVRALEAILHNQWGYIGLMGSKAKIHKILSDLRQAGFTDEQLAGIVTPFGLVQHTHTPEEIAISVAAQLLQVFRDFEASR